jgi:phospholipase C
MSPTRREFLRGLAGLAGAAAVGRSHLGAAVAGAQAGPAGRRGLPAPEQAGIDHVVVVMMENRSFDHYFGWVPGANGRQAGLTFFDRQGIPHTTSHWREFQGCAHPDPDHSFEGGRVQYDDGRCDGWLRSGENDDYSIGYYTDADLAFYRGATRDWTVCDNYFAAIMAETYPNRFYQHAAQTDRIHNSTATASMPTIWDRLADAGLTGRYYFSDAPFTALWGTKYLPISRLFPQFIADCAAGALPEVTFVDPRFLDEGSGTSGDDHPHADIRVGQQFLNQVYDAVTQSPSWPRTVLVINYDEWGGFFDHVPPTVAPDANPDWGLRGFRVPCVVISPIARRGFVSHGQFDHTSILKLIEWRWGLPALTPRDAAARNLAGVLDFRSPAQTDAPRYSVPAAVGLPCLPLAPDDVAHWRELRDQARAQGWSLAA